MSRRVFLQRITHAGVAAALGPFATSCGTLLHPERVGQPSGRIDPAVAILDGLGLLLFFIPGVVAFIVDFSTGAIYLPPEHMGEANPSVDANGLARISVDREQLSRRVIEETVASACGKPVHLEPGHYRAEPLETLEQYPETAFRLASAHEQSGSEVIFRCQSP